MDKIIQTLLQMDPNEISNYINYFFIAVAAVGLIGFIIGFIKGTYREASTFIVTAVYFVLLVFINKIIAEAIYTMDITSILASTGLDVPDEIKTAGDLVTHYFTQICEENGITIGNSEQMINSVIAISLTFINLVVYLVLLIAGIVICFVLDILVYFLIVRLIVPKHVRKHKKMRIVGGAMGLVRYVVAFSLLLSPFTGMVNSTIGKLRDEEGKIQRNELDNDYYNALMNVLEGYNNSAVAQVFFVVKDKEGNSIDVQLMDYITQSKLDEETMISLYDEVGNLGALAVKAMSTGAFDTTNGINYSLLLSAEFVGSAIDLLANSTLIQTLLAVGVTLVVNMDSVKQQIDLSTIDFFSINWNSTFDAIESAYQEMYDSGLITEAIENSEEFMNEFYLDSEYASSIKDAFKALGDNELVCQIMPLLVVSFLNNMKTNKESDTETVNAKRSNDFEIKDELLDVNTYKDIKWGSELAAIYEVFENISKQYYAYENEHLSIGNLQSLGVDVLLNSLFGVGVDFSTNDDDSYADQYDNNVFVNGGNYVNGEITHTIPGTKNILGVGETGGLLNLDIINTMFEYEVFNDMISLLDINSMLEMGEDSVDLNEKVVDVISGWNKAKWQQELGCIIDVVAPIMKLVDIIGGDDATISEVKKAAQEESSSIELDKILGDDSLNCLKRVTDVLNKSEIFTEILPDVLESYTDKQDDELIPGLAMSDLNFTYFVDKDGTMVSELRDFIDEIDGINENLIELIDDIQQEDGAIEALVEDCASSNSVFASLLKIIEGNQIFNKELTNQEKLEGEHKTFTNVMANILGKTDDSSKEMNVYNMTDGKVSIDPQTIYDFESSEDGWDKEIEGLVGFIGSLKGTNSEDQVILDFLTGKTEEGFDLGTEIFGCGNEIERIFASVDESKILKEAFPHTFKELIGDSFNDVIGGAPDFYNIDSWANEGHYFNLLLTSIDSLRENNQSLTEIDWLNVEEEKLVNILTSLYNTQSVGGKYTDENRENGVFDDILKNVIAQALESLEIKIEGDDVPEEDIISRDFDIDGNKKVLYTIYNDRNVYVSWLGDTEASYIGEIKNIASMISSVQNLEEGATINDMDSILESVNNCYILRSTLGLIIESKTEAFEEQDDPLMKEFIHRSDFEVFHKKQLSLTPYKLVDNVVVEESTSVLSSRKQEVELRQEEINHIIDILNDAEDISKELEQGQEGEEFDKINGLLENKKVTGDSTKPEESRIEVMLNNMHDSEIFNSLTHNENNERVLTAFEYFFQYILDDDSFTVNGKPLLVSPTLGDIDAISSDNSSGLEDGWVNGSGVVGEITNFNNALYNAINNPLVDIKLDTSLNFIEALQGQMAQRDEHGDKIKDSNGKFVRDFDKIPVQKLLLDLYESRLLGKSNAHLLDNHIVNYLLDSIGYKDDGTTHEYNVVRQVYTDVINNLSNEELRGRLIDNGLNESEIDENARITLWKNDAKAIEDLIFAINSNLGNLDINSFDSAFIDNMIEPLESSVGLNYLRMDEDEYENDYRSIYQLVVIKIVNTALDAFDNSLGLYINSERISNRLIKDYSKEAGVAGDLINAYKIMNEDNKFSGGNISFESGPGSDEANEAFMDKVVSVLEPLYRSDVYHNYENITLDGNRISKDTSNSEKVQLSNLTLFEQVVYTMLSSSEQLTNELFYDDGGIEYVDTVPVTNGNDVMNLRIREMTKLDADPSSSLKWIILGADNKVVYESEIGKIHDMAGKKLDDMLNPEELDLSPLVKDITIPNSEDKLLNIVNASYILHDIVPHVIGKYVSTHDSENEGNVDEENQAIVVDDLIFLKENEVDNLHYAYVRGYDGEHVDNYRIENSGYSFEVKVEHWNNDLYYVSQLIDLFEEIKDSVSIKEGGDALNEVFEPLLYNLGQTETYSRLVPQMIISILKEYLKVEVFSLTPSLAVFIEGDTKADKLETIYKVVDNVHLVADEPITYSPEVLKQEGAGIDQFIVFLQSRNNEDIPQVSNGHGIGYAMYQGFYAFINSLGA